MGPVLRPRRLAVPFVGGFKNVARRSQGASSVACRRHQRGMSSTGSSHATYLIVGFYCLCSGGMLVINKVVVAYVGVPALITIAQFAATSLVRRAFLSHVCIELTAPLHSAAAFAAFAAFAASRDVTWIITSPSPV